VSAAIPGDFDLDGNVDGHDFLAWQRDPSIGSLDDWRANFGSGSASAAARTVPVPTAAALILAGVAAFGGAKRRSSLTDGSPLTAGARSKNG
jgi:hypothetical protein